tara:strand:+ start:2049 stop:2339 length:291 start_codon:yes stop_codon:yes gene_type:complete
MKPVMFAIWLIPLISSFAHAEKVTALPNKAIVGIGVDASQVTKRVCYYQDQAYSLGAILQVGEHYMICQAANDFETNGSLSWAPYPPKREESVQKP